MKNASSSAAMDPPVLTVVIPAYNVEPYIERCVSSVRAQHTESKVEVIVIDDGSTDETGNIVSRLLADLNNARSIYQPNAGLGAARNLGLSQARGKYVWFVDGDDFLPSQSLDEVVAALEEAAPDVLVLDFSCAAEDGEKIDWIACPFGQDHQRAMTGAEFFLRYHETTYAWLYVIRRQLLLDNSIQFQPRINMQDAELLPRVMAVASQVLVSGIPAYVYVKRTGSFINNPDPIVRERYFASVVEVRRRLMGFLQGLQHPTMRESVIAKLASMNRILLLAYLYDSLDADQLKRRLKILHQEGAYPFGVLSGGSMKLAALRLAVNFQPLWFPPFYRWLRGQSLLRRFMQRRIVCL